MKTYLLFFSKCFIFMLTLSSMSMFFSDVLYSQVPFATVKKDVLKEYKGVTIVDRGGGRVEVDKSYIPNRRFYYAYVRVSSPDKLEGLSAIHHRDVYVTYEFVKGKWTFVSTTKSDQWYVGNLKSPTLSEISEAAKNDLANSFDSYLFNYMTEYNGVKEILAEKFPCYECDNFYWPVSSEGKEVHFRVVIDYSCINGMDLEKRQDVFETSVKRDGINQPWKSVFFKRSGTATKTLETKKMNSEEIEYWKCNSLAMKVYKEKATAEFNKLPKVEIPQFTTAKEMVWWLHKFLRKAKPLEVEYVFLSKLQSWYFLECGSYRLHEDGLKLVENIKDFVGTQRGNYFDHYCENPKIKEQSGNDKDYQVAYYPKWGNTFSRIRVANFKGEFKISSITISRYKDKDKIDEIMNAPASVCK